MIQIKIKKWSTAGLLCLASTAAFSSAMAQQLFNDAVIVMDSLCVGVDCPDNPSFGFDTIRLQENNLRIHFDDTSNSAAFPDNDWRIVINESGNGGAQFFGIEDATSGKSPFRIFAGAPTASLYVAGTTGNVGMGTTNPVVDLHITEGNTPTLRLDQKGGGWPDQIWDVAGNETNFFIRDVTNKSLLPFRIKPGSPNNSLYIWPDRVEVLNTLQISRSGSADWQIVNRSDGAFAINDADTTGADFIFKTADSNANNPWEFVHRTDNALGINVSVTSGAEFILTETGDLTIRGALTTNGPSCSNGCDAVFDAGYALPSIQEQASAMYANGYLPAVGATVPNAPINVTEYVGNMLNELEKAHIHISQLDERNRALDARLAQLEAALLK